MVKHERFPAQRECASAELRGGDRVHLEIIAEVKVGFGAWQKSRLNDVSLSGFRIGWLPNGGHGTDVRIRIPGLEPLTALVRWKDSTGMGCEFTRPLSVYVLEHIARQCQR